MGRRQFYASEEGLGGNFGNKLKSYWGQRSPTGPYFQVIFVFSVLD